MLSQVHAYGCKAVHVAVGGGGGCLLCLCTLPLSTLFARSVCFGRGTGVHEAYVRAVWGNPVRVWGSPVLAVSQVIQERRVCRLSTWKLGATVRIVGILMGKHGATVTIN
jgi:hypothetical protein